MDALVLDEADRMFSDGFADELEGCVTARQTMLFSATMTDDIDALVRMSLHRPLRFFVDPKTVDSKRPVTRIRPRESRKGEGTFGSACGPLQAVIQTRCDHLLQEQETRASNTTGLRSTRYESRRAARRPDARTGSKDSAFRLRVGVLTC